MTAAEEKELLTLVRENNALLKAILKFVYHDEANDFLTNIIANVIGNRIDPTQQQQSLNWRTKR